MKRIELEDSTHQMLLEMSKKQGMKHSDFIDAVLIGLFMDMKRTGRKVLK